MPSNKLLEKVHELDRLVNDLKGNYLTLIDAVKADPDVGMAKAQAIQELADYIYSSTGGLDSLGSRFLMSEGNISDLTSQINDIKSIDLRYIREQLDATIGSYGSLKDAVKNSKAIDIIVNEGAISLDITSFNGVVSKEVLVPKLMSVDVPMNINATTSFVDILMKEQKNGTYNELNLALKDNFRVYNQAYGVFDGNGYRINQGPLGSLVDFSIEEYKQDINGHQLIKSKNFNVLGMIERLDEKSDIRNIFRKSEDLASNHFQAVIHPGSISNIIMMKRPIYMDFIRIYPYTSQAKNKFRVTVYNENETIIGEISSYSFNQTSHNYDDFVDLQIDDVVHYVVLELISFTNVSTLVGFNKIEFYEPDMPVDKDLFITEGIEITPFDLLNGLNFDVQTDYYNTRSAKLRFGLYLNQEPYVMVEASKLYTAKEFTDLSGFRPKKDSLTEFSPTSQFQNTYVTYYIPSLTTFGTVTYSGTLNPNTDSTIFTKTEIDNGTFRSVRSIGPLNVRTKDGFVSDPISFEIGTRVINVNGQELRIKVTEMNAGCRRVVIEEVDEENSIERFKFSLAYTNYGHAMPGSGWSNGSAYPSITDIVEIAPDGVFTFKGVQLHCYVSQVPSVMGCGFFYFVPSNLNQSSFQTFDKGSASAPYGYNYKKEVQTGFVHLPVTFYIGEKRPNGDTRILETSMSSGAYKHKIVQDIQASYGQKQFDRRISDDGLDLLKQKVGYYFKEIQADLYPDGFEFSDTICSSNVRFAIETGNKYRIFTNGSWKDILFENIRTNGMVASNLDSIELISTKNRFFGKIKLVIYVGNGESFTSTKINTLYKSLVKCTIDDVLENGMSESEMALIDKNYIYNVIKDEAIVNIGIVGSNSFKGEITPALKKVKFSMSAVNILRKPTNTENNNLNVEFHPGKVRLSNLSGTDYNLVVKMLEPQKSKIVDNNTVQDLEELMIKADQLSESAESIDHIIQTTAKAAKGYVDEALLLSISNQQDISGVFVPMCNQLEVNSINSPAFIRFSGDRVTDFIGTNLYSEESKYNNSLKVGMNLSTSIRTIKTPIIDIGNNITAFDYKIKADRIPASIELIVNESIRIVTGIVVNNEIIISKRINDLSFEIGVEVKKIQVELGFIGTGILENVNIIPNMTSNTTPSGEVYASSEYNSTTYAPWKTFNRTLEQHGWMTQNGLTYGFIGYRFANTEKKRIGKVVLKSGYNAPSIPDRIKIAGIVNGVEFDLVSWFIPSWPTTNNGVITKEFTPVLCNEIKVYIERLGANYVGLSEIEAYEKDIVIFDYFNFIPTIKGIKEEEGVIPMKQYPVTIPSDGITEFIVCESIPMNYRLLLNGVEQEKYMDYELEQRPDGCYLIWNSQDFDLEIDDELVLITT